MSDEMHSTLPDCGCTECSHLRAAIRDCPHGSTRAAGGMGHAICDDCGAILPDEDPSIQNKR